MVHGTPITPTRLYLLRFTLHTHYMQMQILPTTLSYCDLEGIMNSELGSPAFKFKCQMTVQLNNFLPAKG
jgi:hypothetical protein